MAEENICLVASPNLITRQRRNASQVTCEDNTVERKRIAKILLDCSDLGKVPCSVYGRNRYKKFPGYFFCSRCKKGDDEEASRPNCYINRKAENGRYTCTAEHTDYWEPTQIDPKSKYQPDPPPSSLFCVPISQRPQFISPCPKIVRRQKENQATKLDDILLSSSNNKTAIIRPFKWQKRQAISKMS